MFIVYHLYKLFIICEIESGVCWVVFSTPVSVHTWDIPEETVPGESSSHDCRGLHVMQTTSGRNDTEIDKEVQ